MDERTMNEEFGTWLRKQRKEKRLTLRVVAERAKMGIGHLSLLENGKRKPKPESLAPLALALGVPYGELLQAAGYLDDRNLLFAHRLRSTRVERNMDIQEVAVACGLSPKTIKRWESGPKQLPANATVERLAEYLQVTPDYLLGFTDRPERTALDLRDLLEQENVSYNGTPLTDEQRNFVHDLIRKVLDLSSTTPSSSNSRRTNDPS
ncbi:helix-turn-helix domain-containing protein [Alicyclobacillus hesperidum]|uniref:helix-turn-helix domain-containing protein n=1 Tax=Alicyclobacillus hesperidum TaxID=89784 RepID=UPI00178C2DDF|nr:helix-turn-helix transcriptional regulator [Alicyclobacillus hesperidum]